MNEDQSWQEFRKKIIEEASRPRPPRPATLEIEYKDGQKEFLNLPPLPSTEQERQDVMVALDMFELLRPLFSPLSQSENKKA